VKDTLSRQAICTSAGIAGTGLSQESTVAMRSRFVSGLTLLNGRTWTQSSSAASSPTARGAPSSCRCSLTRNDALVWSGSSCTRRSISAAAGAVQVIRERSKGDGSPRRPGPRTCHAAFSIDPGSLTSRRLAGSLTIQGPSIHETQFHTVAQQGCSLPVSRRLAGQLKALIRREHASAQLRHHYRLGDPAVLKASAFSGPKC
jgi:hypothetical protein